jgi:hypothetical protein
MAKKHTHRYHRIDIGRDKEVWVMKCVKDNCTHYVFMKTKLSAPLLRGQVAECNRCEEDMILDRRSLRMAKPCCIDCSYDKGDKKEKLKSAEDFFKELENGLVK